MSIYVRKFKKVIYSIAYLYFASTLLYSSNYEKINFSSKEGYISEAIDESQPVEWYSNDGFTFEVNPSGNGSIQVGNSSWKYMNSSIEMKKRHKSYVIRVFFRFDRELGVIRGGDADLSENKTDFFRLQFVDSNQKCISLALNRSKNQENKYQIKLFASKEVFIKGPYIDESNMGFEMEDSTSDLLCLKLELIRGKVKDQFTCKGFIYNSDTDPDLENEIGFVEFVDTLLPADWFSESVSFGINTCSSQESAFVSNRLIDRIEYRSK